MNATSTPTLATRFSRGARVLHSGTPLDEERMRQVAPSIFATGRHASRSERYAYIPTIAVLRGLQREGFEPFMVAQGSSRIEGKAAYTKHMVRLRHQRDLQAPASARPEVNEIILINSHDGASVYQLLSGRWRFVCHNGLVLGETSHDIRIPHRGQIEHEVIEGATRVLEHFSAVDEQVDAMKALQLDAGEEQAFARAALTLRYGEHEAEQGGSVPDAPITAEQLTEARRTEDLPHDLWTSLQRVSENILRGGQPGRSASGRRTRTRPVASIDRHVGLNRALWRLAEEMRRLKS